MDAVISTFWPSNAIIERAAKEEAARFANAAWDSGGNGMGFDNISPYLMPVRPVLDYWHTSIVHFNSYADADLVTADVRNFGIEWVMRVENNAVRFESPEDYAARAAKLERFPQDLFYDFGFPQELRQVTYE